MIRYLFDTDTASYFPVLQTRCRNALSAGDVAISVITEAELLFGLALAPESRRLHTAVKIFLSSIPCFDWSRTAAEHFARVRAQLQRIVLLGQHYPFGRVGAPRSMTYLSLRFGKPPVRSCSRHGGHLLKGEYDAPRLPRLR